MSKFEVATNGWRRGLEESELAFHDNSGVAGVFRSRHFEADHFLWILTLQRRRAPVGKRTANY